VFWRVHLDAGSKVMSDVRLALDWAGGKFLFFSPIFFVLCGQERVNYCFIAAKTIASFG
jgi:hypothetical protein